MTKMVTKLGLVVLLIIGISFLAISVWACIRRLKKTKNSDALIVAWIMARVVFCAIVLILAHNNQILNTDFFVMMPAMVLVYEIASLHLTHTYVDRTIKFDKVYAHISQTALLAVISIFTPSQQGLFGMWSVAVLTMIDAIAISNTISLPNKNEETETKTDA